MKGELLRLDSLSSGDDAHAMLDALVVLNRTVDEGEQRIVLTTADVGAGVDVRAALTNEDIARLHNLTAETLATKSLRVRVTAVAGGTESFFVCHVCTCSFKLRRQLAYSAAGASASAAAAFLAREVAWTLVTFSLVSC